MFNDPVTLETGKTYERRAIQEWLDRGNSSCPITHKKLHINQLSKTIEDIQAMLQKAKEAALKRERVPVHAFSHQM